MNSQLSVYREMFLRCERQRPRWTHALIDKSTVGTIMSSFKLETGLWFNLLHSTTGAYKVRIDELREAF